MGAIVRYGLLPEEKRDKVDEQLCLEQFERDTKWCDNTFRGDQNIACHDWAGNELTRRLKGEPRQPFKY
jgi:hypothetical protein